MTIIAKFKDWLLKTNGWQRIWFVTSALGFTYFILLFPIIESNKGSNYRFDTKWAIEKEFKKKECIPYITQPFESLQEPEFDLSGDTSCYNIYSYRKYSENHSPISEQNYQNEFSRNEWNIYFIALSLGILIALFLAAFSYGIGFVIAWIIRGFRKTNDQP
jgi:hypothetical protein